MTLSSKEYAEVILWSRLKTDKDNDNHPTQ